MEVIEAWTSRGMEAVAVAVATRRCGGIEARCMLQTCRHRGMGFWSSGGALHV